jgi:hypothetical protein
MKNETVYFVYFDSVDDWQIVNETEIPLDKLEEAFDKQVHFKDVRDAADYVLFNLNFVSRAIDRSKDRLFKLLESYPDESDEMV